MEAKLGSKFPKTSKQRAMAPSTIRALVAGAVSLPSITWAMRFMSNPKAINDTGRGSAPRTLGIALPPAKTAFKETASLNSIVIPLFRAPRCTIIPAPPPQTFTARSGTPATQTVTGDFIHLAHLFALGSATARSSRSGKTANKLTRARRFSSIDYPIIIIAKTTAN